MIILNKECKDLISKTKYLVEADSFSRHMIWSEHHEHEVWSKNVRVGGMQQVGEIDGRPVTIEMFWENINKKWVCFYHGCSQVVDHNMIELWLKSTFPKVPRSDAMNYSYIY